MTLSAIEIGDETPTALYRLYDADGVLLYVGVTGNLKGRLATHAESKPWWPKVKRKTVEWHETRRSADRAEVQAIRSENPVHNIHGRKVPEFNLRKHLTGAELYELALQKMPPTTLRLRMLELAGVPTNEALDLMGIGRTHRYRVIGGYTGSKPPPQ